MPGLRRSRSCTLGSWTSGPICQSVRAEALSREGTVACKLQREIVLLLAWGPAILLQLGHPLVARGIAEHSAFRAERWGRVRRFHRTLSTMLQLCFGTEQESRTAVMQINAIHDRVHGCLAEAEGIFSAGTPYSAHDLTLLSWVHATLLAMNLCVYEIYVGDLSPEERDRYCAEASAMESPLGIPEGRLPRSFSQLRGYIDEMLASGEIVVTEAARMLAKEIVYPLTTRVVGTAMWLMRLPSIGLLPPEIRRSYGFRWGARTRSCSACLRGLSEHCCCP